MIVINERSGNRFEIDGVEYFKNFTPVVRGNKVKIVNTYDHRIEIMPLTEYTEVTLDGSVRANLEALQSALLPVLFTKQTLGGEGSAVWGTITGDIQSQTDLINLFNAKPTENEYDNIPDMISDQANQTTGFYQYVIDASAHDDIDSGFGLFEYLGTTTLTLDDYRLLSEEESQVVQSSPNYRSFKVEEFTTSALSNTSNNRIGIRYDGGTNKVIEIRFDRRYSKYLISVDAVKNDFIFHLQIHNKTKNRIYSDKISGFTFASNRYLLSLNSGIASTGSFDIDDTIEVFIDVSSLASSGSVQSVSGDGVDNTDPINPVLSFPDASEIAETTTKKILTAAERTQINTNATDIDNIETKTDHITVTQAVDLDQMESDISDIPDDFTDLDDTPSTLSAQGLKLVRVNAAGTTLEFVDPSLLGGIVSVATLPVTGVLGLLYYLTTGSIGYYIWNGATYDQVFLAPKEEEITGTRDTANVSTTKAIDWDAFKVFEYTLTALTVFSDSNLPTGTDTKVIELILTGDFTITLPAYWEALPSNDDYDGTVRNHLVVSCIKGTTSSEDVVYSLQNLAT